MNSGRTLRRKKCGCTMGFFLIASSPWILDLWEVCNSWDAHSREPHWMLLVVSYWERMLLECCTQRLGTNQQIVQLWGNDKLLWKTQKFDTIPDWCEESRLQSLRWSGLLARGSLLLIMQVLWSQKTWSFVFSKVLD